MRRCLSVLLLSLAGLPALAADVCPLARMQTGAADVATRIVAHACEEHQLWHRPFIDEDGRLAGSTVREAETALLANGEQAWRRVAGYWRDSGLLPRAAGRPGAQDCAYAGIHAHPSAGCRSFIVDVPWSAAFVSWVMRRAGVPGFAAAPGHVEYVRDAWHRPGASAYAAADPLAARPAPGDLLCFVRSPLRILGFDGLAALLAGSDDTVAMHCDIVVATDPDGDGLAYLVGGNVLDGVTMRLLRLAPGGRFASLPLRTLDEPACSPDQRAACDANRQDWAVLMRLRPAQELAQLAPPPPLPAGPALVPAPSGTPAGQPARRPCCYECRPGDGLPPCEGAGPSDGRR